MLFHGNVVVFGNRVRVAVFACPYSVFVVASSLAVVVVVVSVRLGSFAVVVPLPVHKFVALFAAADKLVAVHCWYTCAGPCVYVV